MISVMEDRELVEIIEIIRKQATIFQYVSEGLPQLF